MDTKKNKLKWVKNDISFTRDNYRPIVARFDNSNCWFKPTTNCSALAFRSIIRKLAQEYNAKVVWLKHLDSGKGKDCPQLPVVSFYIDFDGHYRFRKELGKRVKSPKRYKYYEPKDLFTNI